MGRLQQSVSGLLNTANSSLDQITALTKAVLCIPTTLSSFTRRFSTSKGFFAITAKSIAQEIIGGVTQMVDQIVNGAVNAVLSVVENELFKVLEYLNDISGSIDEIKSFINGIGIRGQELVDVIKNDQNCTASNSSFFSCMVTTAVNQLTNKAVAKINNSLQDEVGNITNQITNKITQSGGVFESVVNRQVNFIDKISNQISILL